MRQEGWQSETKLARHGGLCPAPSEALQALPLSSSHAERAGHYSGICLLGCLLCPQGGRHPEGAGICSGTASRPPRQGPGAALQRRERSRQAGTQRAGQAEQAEQTPRSPLLCPRPHLAIPGLVANTVWIVTRVGREFLPQRWAQAAARGGEGCEPEQRSWAPAGGKLAAHPHRTKRDTPTARQGTVALSPGLTDGRAAGGAAEMEVGLQGYVICSGGEIHVLKNKQILMTKPLTPLATLFHWHPLPRALHSRCTVVMTVCVILVNSRPPSYMQVLARLAQRAWRLWERASLC